MQVADNVTPTGIEGLDYILCGGFRTGESHLLEGLPGVGKTTLALQFLAAGRDRGETGMFVCASEPVGQITRMAANLGISLEGIDIFDLLAAEASKQPFLDQSIMHTADLELGETIESLMERIALIRPQRIVISSFSEIHLLADEPLPFRRYVRKLFRCFTDFRCASLLLDNLTMGDDTHLQSLADCVIRLEQLPVNYGGERRRLRVSKLRGGRFHSGYHDYVIRDDRIQVFPRLVTTSPPHLAITDTPVTTGLAALDALLGGGLEPGTTTLIRGPSGSGKSALALQTLNAILAGGGRAMFVSFDETLTNFLRRSHTLGIPISKYLESGALRFLRVDPAELSPGELAHCIRDNVAKGITAIVMDSLSGYQHAMLAENNLMLQLRELLTFLNQQGVVTIMVLANGETEAGFGSPLYVTYLADTVIVIRHVEMADGVRRVISVGKKRTGDHEHGSRELFIDHDGIRIGTTLYSHSAMRQSQVIDVTDPLFNARPDDCG